MDSYYHRTNNIDSIASSGRVRALKHIARHNPSLELEVEHGAGGTNLGGLRSNRQKMTARDAYAAMEGVKNVDDVFVTKDTLPPRGYGKYVIEKNLSQTRADQSINLIANEHLVGRELSVRSNAKVYVPDEEHETLSGRYRDIKFIPMSQLKARQANLMDRAKSLYGKLTKSANVDTLYSGSERDIKRLLSQNAAIVGSEGIGINVEGASDRDILIPYKTRDGYNRLVNKLEKDGFGLQESIYNSRKRDGYKVYSYKNDNVEVDVALVHGGKSVDLANHVRHLRGTLSDKRKQEIIDKKERLQNAWFFKDTRYKNYKRKVDEQLGLTRFHE